MVNIADEKRKILDGTYPSRVIMGRQNKHIEGTIELLYIIPKQAFILYLLMRKEEFEL